MAKDIGKCPNCGARVYETAKGYSCSNWSNKQRPCNLTIWKVSYGAEFSEGDAKRLLAGEDVRKQNVTMDGECYEAVWFLTPGQDKPTFRKDNDE